MKTRKICVDTTYRGLNKWYSAMFEKLGWIVLANENGMKYKVESYKKSLEKLKCSINKKIISMNDLDKKKDLVIMSKNLQILINHVDKDF